MPWIKSNPHLAALIVLALGALAASGYLVMSAGGFNEKFVSVQSQPSPGRKIAALETKVVEDAQKEFTAPAMWTATDEQGSLFVSKAYTIDAEKKLEKLGTGAKNKDSFTGKPIPDRWFMDRKLPFLTAGVTRQDPDGDGFFNEDEFRANTNPNDKTSHPPYVTKLFLKKFIRVPFLLKFQVYDGDPKKLDEMQFQINTLSLRQPTLFLKIGEMVPKTKFKIKAFALKANQMNDKGFEEDLSELTLVDTELNTEVVLVMNKVTDSPDSFALFTYIWPQPPKDIQVKKLKEFALQPETTLLYKLLDVQENEALIQAPSGEKLTIPRLPAGYP